MVTPSAVPCCSPAHDTESSIILGFVLKSTECSNWFVDMIKPTQVALEPLS